MIWDMLFNRNSSKEEAKQRLTIVLSYERRVLPPNFINMLKDDLISLFSKYPQFEVNKIEVDIRKDKDDFDELWISIPFKQ